MKIFSWMHSKLSGSQRFSKPNVLPAKNYLMHETCKEEFSDWLSGLLAIGTFGTSNLKDTERDNVPGDIPPSEDHPEETTYEELAELQKELKLLSSKQVAYTDSDLADESPKHNLPPEKFFDFQRTLEDEKSTRELISSALASEDTTAVSSKGKDDHLNKKKTISKRSLTFLLRKAFHRTGKSKLSSLLGDPVLPELKLEKSRVLEKILRVKLKKKVYPQGCNPKATTNKSLDQKHLSDTDSEDEAFEERSTGSKWVKTDSDFIVLEI